MTSVGIRSIVGLDGATDPFGLMNCITPVGNGTTPNMGSIPFGAEF